MTTTAPTTTTITATKGGRPPGHHHEPAPTTTAASNCSWGGGGVLTDGDNQGTRDGRRRQRRHGHAEDDGRRGEWGERTAGGTKATGRGRGRPHDTRNGPKRCLSSFGPQASFFMFAYYFFLSTNLGQFYSCSNNTITHGRTQRTTPHPLPASRATARGWMAGGMMTTARDGYDDDGRTGYRGRRRGDGYRGANREQDGSRAGACRVGPPCLTKNARQFFLFLSLIILWPPLALCKGG